MTALPGYVTVGEAARRLGRSKAMVKYLAHHGKLEARKPGRDLLITEDSLREPALPFSASGEAVLDSILDSYVTVPEAARRTGLTPGYFVNLIHSQKLLAHRVGRDWFIELPAFNAMFGERVAERERGGVVARAPGRRRFGT